MDSAINILLSWQFLLFALCMFAFTFIIRRYVEYFLPKTLTSTLWNKLLLPTMPIILGAIIAYVATKYPYPDGLITTSARIMFGTVAGMFSTISYQVVYGMLKDKIQSYQNATNSVNSSSGIK